MKSRSGARLPTRQAMDFVKNELDLVNQTNDVGVLYSVRQNIAEALRGKYAGTSKTVDMANVKLAKKELNDVLDVIDNEIDRVAPGYKRLQADYSEQARPISSARTINEITANASKGVPDPIYNQQTLTPAAFRRELENHADEIAKMTPEQQQVLQKVLADIDRSNAVYSPTVRAAGSDTFRNMSVASLISNTFGGGAINNATVRALTKPFGFIFEKLQGDELRSLLTEAMLDPKIGAKMLEKATPENVQTVAEFLRNGAIRNFLSTSARVSANEQEKRQYGGPR